MKTNKQINKIKILLTVSIVIFSTLSTIALAENDENKINIKYEFSQPEITKITFNDISYDKIIMENTISKGDPGKPALPVKGAYVLLPPGRNTKSINVISAEKVCLGDKYHIEPATQKVPISQINPNFVPITDEKVYSSKFLYPDNLVTEVGTYNLKGYCILVLNINPVQYIPASGELFYYSEITISIDTIEDESSNLLYRGFEKDRYDVTSRVDNPEMILSYDSLLEFQTISEGYDLMILTSDELSSGFEELRDFHNDRGILTEIKTIGNIGSNRTEDIRNYIREEYSNSGIEYILIGADFDVIPTPYLYDGTYFIPSDLYYCCLDGPFNFDGDEFWGEPNDGENGADVDLFAEIYAGRACADNLQEVEIFVNKTITYLTLDPEDEYLKHNVLAGEVLIDPALGPLTPRSTGGEYMDELINESYANEYYTVGIPYDDNWIDKLYDRNFPDPDPMENGWPVDEIIHRINNDTHMINHVGHASSGDNMKIHIDDVQRFTNDKLCFIYSQGCSPGAFDNPCGFDCIAEHFTIKTPHGAFAGIWNSRSGFLDVEGTNGPSQHYHREFIDAIYGEKIRTISKANQDSKEDIAFMIDMGCMRLCYYQLNLFGDPTIDLIVFDTRNNAPDRPVKPNGEIQGKINVEYTYTTSTIDPDDDQVLYLWDWGDGNFSDWLGPYNSEAKVKANHTWTKKGDYEIKVKSKDVHGDESNWSEPLGVIMPKNKPKIISLFDFLMQRFPLLQKIFENSLIIQCFS